MKYHVTVNFTGGKIFRAKVNNQTAIDLVDFIDGKSSEKFFTIHAGTSFCMLSRKYIEHVMFEAEEE